MIKKFNVHTALILSVVGVSLTLAIGLIGIDSTMVSAQPQETTSSSNATNPIIKAGPLTAVRHVYDDPTLRVFHYCTPHHNIMAVCSLFDTNQKNATLIGIEYMLTPEDYMKLPEREKPYWHYHVTEFAPNRADPHFPMLSAEDEKKVLKMI